MITSRPVSTDDVMAELKISRGNAHMNLRELVGWGLVRSVIRKGERKEFFEAEKDVWKMFCIIVRERKRREIQPAIGVLKSCVARVADLQGEEATAFSRQTQALCDFMEMADKVLSRVARSEASTVLPWAMRYLSR